MVLLLTSSTLPKDCCSRSNHFYFSAISSETCKYPCFSSNMFTANSWLIRFENCTFTSYSFGEHLALYSLFPFCILIHPSNTSYINSIFWQYGTWTQGLMLARQALYTGATHPALFALVILDTRSHFLPGPPRPQSSYLYFLHSWSDKHVPLCPDFSIDMGSWKLPPP
jgi:hypothetical protein